MGRARSRMDVGRWTSNTGQACQRMGCWTRGQTTPEENKEDPEDRHKYNSNNIKYCHSHLRLFMRTSVCIPSLGHTSPPDCPSCWHIHLQYACVLIWARDQGRPTDVADQDGCAQSQPEEDVCQSWLLLCCIFLYRLDEYVYSSGVSSSTASYSVLIK